MNGAVLEAIGVDVGGTRTAALRVTAEGTIIDRVSSSTPAEDTAATLGAMVDSVRAMLTPEVAAIGIAAAGLVETGTEVLRFAPNIAWRDVNLVAMVEGETGLPVSADNDNTAAAWGELRCGAAQGCEHVLLVGVGTGIGGGIVIGGSLLRGKNGFAGEIGHIVVEPDGERCGCGNLGCWETVASGAAILREGRWAVEHGSHSILAEIASGDPARVTGEMVTEAARAGDPTARGILVEVGHRLGEGIAGLVNVLDPEIVVVGGGASAAGDLLLEPARASFRTTVEGFVHRPDVPIVVAELGNDAGGVGAALLALEALT
jgi:glucokinase